MVKNLIDFFITIEFLLFQFLDLAVGFLHLLQPKPYTTNTGFIRFFIGKLGSKGIPKILKLWQSIGSADSNLMIRQKA